MKNTKRILLSVITLVLVVVALGTTTFAWFTLSNVATVSNITGEVTAGEGLLVAFGVDGNPVTDFRTNLTSDDWATVLEKINEGGKNFKFGAVSLDENKETFSTLVASSEKAGLLEQVVEGNEDGNTTLKNEENGYLEFTIHFQSNTAGSINWTGFEFDKNPITFTSKTKFTGAKEAEVQVGGEVKTDAANAARIGIFGGAETPVIVQKPEGDENTITKEGKAIFNGQFSYLTSLGNSITWGEKEVVTGENVTSITIAKAETELNDNTIIDLKPITTTEDEGNETASYEAFVTVKVWLEGWDPDTFDAIFGSKLGFNLTFKKEASK